MGPSSSISDGAHPADVALTLSRQLVSVVRVKNMLDIEAVMSLVKSRLRIRQILLFLVVDSYAV